jgi:hypothetical protein
MPTSDVLSMHWFPFKSGCDIRDLERLSHAYPHSHIQSTSSPDCPSYSVISSTCPQVVSIQAVMLETSRDHLYDWVHAFDSTEFLFPYQLPWAIQCALKHGSCASDSWLSTLCAFVSTELWFSYLKPSMHSVCHSRSETWYICLKLNWISMPFNGIVVPYTPWLQLYMPLIWLDSSFHTQNFPRHRMPIQALTIVHMPCNFESAVWQNSRSLHALTFNEIWNSSNRSNLCSYSLTVSTSHACWVATSLMANLIHFIWVWWNSGSWRPTFAAISTLCSWHIHQ